MLHAAHGCLDIKMIRDTKFHKPKILVVIPLYNHADTIRDVISRCRAIHKHVLVIDDGSTDLKENTFQGFDITHIRHEQNRGKGAAIMTAAKKASAMGMTHIITIDADLQHIPEEIQLFIEAIHEDPTGLFVGKRDFTSAQVPDSSNFGRSFSNFWYRVQTGRKIGDAQSGFRAYPLFVLTGLKLSDRHYSFEVEVLVKATWTGICVRDIDISVYYPPGDERITHFNLLLDNLRLTHLNTKLTLRSFIPIPHKQLQKRPGAGYKFSVFSPLKSIRKLLAEDISPFRIAFSGSIGIFLGTLPLIAVHTLVILFVSGFFRLNKIVAVGASQFCMPPLVPALCIEAGYFMTHNGTFLTEISIKTLGIECLDRLFEWFIGSLVIAPLLSAIGFLIIYITAQILTGSVKRFNKNGRV